MTEDMIMTSTGEEIASEQTQKETDRKCPQCGGVMDFDPKTGGLRCPFCDYTEEIPIEDEAVDGPAQELDINNALLTQNCDWGAKKKVIICKSCGAEAIYDELQLANECPYCGSNQVMEEKDEQTMAPGGVVTFKITAKEAAAKFTNWIKGRLFCPKAAKESAKPKSFKGIYLPYWTFDAKTVSRYSAMYGINRTVGEGEDKKTVTDWYPTSGVYREEFDDELVLGSNRFNENLMSGVEPFNTADNKGYKPEYVAGFIAERYTIGLKDAYEKAKSFIKKKVEANIRHKVQNQYRADAVRLKSVQIRYYKVTYKYLLLPVWLSTYQYNGKVYHYMVNGQTGKAGGETPTSWLRVLIAIMFITALVLLVSEFADAGIILAVLAVILCVVCNFVKM